MTSITQLFVVAFAHSATTAYTYTCTSRDKCRRDTGDGALKPGEIIAIVSTILAFLVGIPGLIMVFTQARKYWRRRTKRVPDVELNTSTSENTVDFIPPATSHGSRYNNITININNVWSAHFSRHDASAPILAVTQYEGPRGARDPTQEIELMPPERASTWPCHR